MIGSTSPARVPGLQARPTTRTAGGRGAGLRLVVAALVAVHSVGCASRPSSPIVVPEDTVAREPEPSDLEAEDVPEIEPEPAVDAAARPELAPEYPSVLDADVLAMTLEEDFAQFPASASRRFDLSIRGGDMRTVLLAVAESAGLSLVMGPDVRGVVTHDLRGVTLPVLLRSVLEPKGLSYRVVEDTVHIERRRMETRLLRVDLPATRRLGEHATDIDLATGPARSAVSSTRIHSEALADPWNGITEALAALTAVPTDARAPASVTKPHAILDIDRSSGTVLIRHYPEVIAAVERYLGSVADIARRQLHVRTRVLEVALESSAADIDWRRVRADVPAARDSWSPGHPPARLDAALIDRVVEGLRSQGAVRVIAAPSAIASNNQPIALAAGSSGPRRAAAVHDAGARGAGDRPSAGVDSGMSFWVVASLAADGWITVDVAPFVAESLVAAGAGTVETLSWWTTDQRFRMRPGEAAVLTGVFRDPRSPRAPTRAVVAFVGVDIVQER